MRKRLKKLCIAAAVLAALGVILCVVAFVGSKKAGTELFSQTENEDGNYVYDYGFNGEAIKKLSVSTKYADINIIGGADRDRIELVNFAEQNFRMAVSATTITIEDRDGFAGLFSFNFGGLRNYLNSFRIFGKVKTINIYLTDASSLRLVETKIYSGDVTVKNCNNSADYDFKLKYGSVSVDSLTTGGTLSLVSSDGNIDIVNSTIKKQTSKLTHGYENIVHSEITELDAEIKTGYFKYETGDYDVISSVMTLASDDGRVRYGDDIYENGKFSQGMRYTGISDIVQIVIDVHVEEGNIMITK